MPALVFSFKAFTVSVNFVMSELIFCRSDMTTSVFFRSVSDVIEILSVFFRSVSGVTEILFVFSQARLMIKSVTLTPINKPASSQSQANRFLSDSATDFDNVLTSSFSSLTEISTFDWSLFILILSFFDIYQKKVDISGIEIVKGYFPVFAFDFFEKIFKRLPQSLGNLVMHESCLA